MEQENSKFGKLKTIHQYSPWFRLAHSSMFYPSNVRYLQLCSKHCQYQLITLYVNFYFYTVMFVLYTGKLWLGEKLANLVYSELFAKLFLASIHSYTKSLSGICTDCSLFAKIFLTNSFYLYSLPNFPCQIFPVYGKLLIHFLIT